MDGFIDSRPAGFLKRLPELEPGAGARGEVVHVIDCDATGGRIWLRADATAQEALVFRTG